MTYWLWFWIAGKGLAGGHLVSQLFSQKGALISFVDPKTISDWVVCFIAKTCAFATSTVALSKSFFDTKK
jgi:hypothetical protein